LPSEASVLVVALLMVVPHSSRLRPVEHYSRAFRASNWHTSLWKLSREDVRLCLACYLELNKKYPPERSGETETLATPSNSFLMVISPRKNPRNRGNVKVQRPLTRARDLELGPSHRSMATDFGAIQLAAEHLPSSISVQPLSQKVITVKKPRKPRTTQAQLRTLYNGDDKRVKYCEKGCGKYYLSSHKCKEVDKVD